MATQGGEELNDAQKRFCEEYIFDFNGTRSYKVAFPKTKTDNTAGVEAHKLLRKPKIKQYIRELQSDLAKTSGISRLKVLREHEKIAFSSIADFHNTWLTRKEFEKLTPNQKACISEIETKTEPKRGRDGKMKDYEYVKIKLYDKHRALEAINKMLGYNEPDEIEGQLTIKVIRE